MRNHNNMSFFSLYLLGSLQDKIMVFNPLSLDIHTIDQKTGSTIVTIFAFCKGLYWAISQPNICPYSIAASRRSLDPVSISNVRFFVEMVL